MSGEYNGAEEAMIDLWVESQLAGMTAMNVAFPGLTSRIFNRLATGQPAYPYIVYQAQSPPRVIRGVGTAEVMVDTIYVVKAIAQCSDYDPLVPVAQAIRAAMVTVNEVITGSIGTVFTCTYERQFSMVETEQSSQFRHLGGEFHIQAQAA